MESGKIAELVWVFRNLNDAHIKTMIQRITLKAARLGTPLRYTSTKTDFGFQEVNAADKEMMVRNVFSSVASKYDIMNDFMSVGVHRLWKDEFVNMMGLPAAANADPNCVPRLLDVAGGTGNVTLFYLYLFRSFYCVKIYFYNYTGDISFRTMLIMASSRFGSVMEERLENGAYDSLDTKPIVVCDINPDMLAVGKDRAVKAVGATNARMVSNTPVCHNHHPTKC